MVTFLTTCKVLPTPDAPQATKRQLPQFSRGNYQINWIGVIFLTYPPTMVIIGFLIGLHFSWKMLACSIFWLIVNGLIGNTAGYHRLFSHRSYEASTFLRYLCAFLGAGTFQGSVRWWAKLHRIHHKYVDTDLDPYNAKRGVFFSHCGWFLMRIDYDLLGKVDISDLDRDPVIRWQRKYYGWICAVSGFLLPYLTSGYVTGDWVGAYFFGANFKIFLLHHCTFCINSLAHTSWLWAGHTYSVDNTPHDSLICSILAFGEGYHNYHHAFADDYRNGVRWYQWDPTKWWIYACSQVGLTWNLKRVPKEVFLRARLHAQQLKHESRARKCAERLKSTSLLVTEFLSMGEVDELVKSGRKLIIVDGYVLDLEQPIELEASATHSAGKIHWLDAHPGGRAFLNAYIGRDATEAVNGGVYKHTHGAHSIMTELRVAHLKRKN